MRPGKSRKGTALAVLIAVSFSHLLNDIIQSLLPAIYPVLKSTFALNFGQVGLITFTFQLTASVMQPLVGYYTDQRPSPFSLPVGMSASLVGLVLLSMTSSFPALLLAAGLVGLGSGIFHPEASRVARRASGGRYGFAQSVFQVGGSTGSAVGPLLAAFIVVPGGQQSVLWFSIAALAAIVVLFQISRWYAATLADRPGQQRHRAEPARSYDPKIIYSLLILVFLVFSKNFYTASLNSYYTFYLIETFGVPVQTAQLYLFLFLASVAAGTLFGGPLGDRFGRKYSDLVLDLRGAAVYARSALCRPLLDSGVNGGHRPDPVVVGSCHHRLCTRAGAGTNGHSLGAVFRPCFRDRWAWGGPPGPLGGPDRYPLRLPRVLVPARLGLARRFPSAYPRRARRDWWGRDQGGQVSADPRLNDTGHHGRRDFSCAHGSLDERPVLRAVSRTGGGRVWT